MDSRFQDFLRDLQTLIDRYSSAAATVEQVMPIPTVNLDQLNSTIHLRFIAEHVAAHFGLHISAIVCKKGKTGPQLHAEIRFMAYRLSKRFTRRNQNAIAAFFNRDHSAIKHGLDRFEDLYTSDPEYAAAYDLLQSNLAAIFEPKPRQEAA